MALTKNLSTFAQYTVTQLKDPTFMAANKIALVMYGDQDKIGQTPLICVEPNTKSLTLNGAPRRVQVDLEVFVFIYFGLIQDVQSNRLGADVLAEAVEDQLHKDPTCGGICVASLVSQVSSGVSNKSGSLVRAARLTFTGRSQVMLPMAGA